MLAPSARRRRGEDRRIRALADVAREVVGLGQNVP
jgi:hypothetical protein